MKKILINRKPLYNQAWGGGIQFVNNFDKYFNRFGYKVVYSLESDIDYIVMIDPRLDDLGISINEILRYKQIKPEVKIIHRVNENDARKGTTDIDPLLRECSKYTDASCFIGKWIHDYHIERGWYCERNLVIHSGCDKEIFKPNKKYSEDDGKVHIISHHWSDNPMKSQGVNEWLDDFVGNNSDFTFTYIGRTKTDFKNSKHIQPLFGKALGEELGKYDVCINGSYQDPFPNSCIEILSCKIPLYVMKNGGGATEAAGLDHNFETFDELEKILLKKEFMMNISFIPYDWNTCMQKYKSVIESL